MGRRQFSFVGSVFSFAIALALVGLVGLAHGQDAPAEPAAPAVELPAVPGALTPAGDPPAAESSAVTPEPKANSAAGANSFFNKMKLPAARVDPQVKQTDAPAPTAPTSPAPAAPSAASEPAEGGKNIFIIDPERLTEGRQDVSVSVQVQGPPDLNLQKDAAFKILVRNTGTADAMKVTVRDELPEGLTYVDSEPKAKQVGSMLVWSIDTLRAGEDRVISLKLKPTKRGALDHAASVSFMTGSKARTHIHEPRLKVEQTLSATKVLKGQPVDFRIAIRNTGDGPARNVIVQAKLSPGLRHESGSHPNEDTVYEIAIPEIASGQVETLDPLVVDTTQGGEQWCAVKVSSDDVVPNPEEAEQTAKLEVVEPKLKMVLSGPPKRFTETVAPYKITLENPGTAPAKNVTVVASMQLDGKLIKVPPNADYDSRSRRLRWTFPEIKPGDKSPEMVFEVMLNRVGRYDVTADAKGDGALADNSVFHTEVEGMTDVNVLVIEKRRNVDIGGETMFVVRLRNYGTKDAAKLRVIANVSDNLEITEIAGGPATDDKVTEKRDEVKFTEIEHLGAGKELNLGVKVKVKNDKPRRAFCRVRVTHDDFTEPVEGIKDITVTNSRDLSQNP